MSNLIRYVQNMLPAIATSEGEPLLAPKQEANAMVVAGAGNTQIIDVTPQAPGVSATGDKLILGYPVYRTAGGWVVGSSDRTLTAEPTSHMSMTASAGSGKGTSTVITNALNWSASLIALDVKFEIARGSAEYRRDVLGQEIYILDPFKCGLKIWEKMERRWPGRYPLDETFLSAVCNPLENIDVDDPQFDRVARDIAVALCPQEPGEKNPFFPRSAQEYIFRIIKAVCSGYTGRAIDGKWVRDYPSLVAVRKVIERGRVGIKDIIERCQDRDERFADQLRTYTSHIDSVEDTIRTAEVSTSWIADKEMELFLEATDGRPFDLKWVADPTKKFSLYIVLPGDAFQTMGGWVRMLVQRIIHECMRAPREDKLLLLLDEAGTIGRIEALPEAYGVGRGAGLCCWTFWQDMSQAKNLYGEMASTFSGNSEVSGYFSVTDYETANHVASRIGRHLKRRDSYTSSHSSSPQGGSSSSTTTSSWNYEALMDAAAVEQSTQRVIANFIRRRDGGLFWSAPMDYFACPFFNGKWRPDPDKPLLGDATWRPAMTVEQFTAWRRSYLK